MKLVNKKILAVDLDGTLFTDEKDICKKNLNALNSLLDMGHILVIDTGRPSHVVKKILKRFSLFERDNIYLLGYQGSICTRYNDDIILFGNYLKNDSAISLLKHSVSAGLSTLAFEYENIYSFWMDENIEEYSKLSHEMIEIIDSPDELKNHKLTKIMAIDYNGSKALYDFQSSFQAEFDECFESMFSNPAFLEYIGRGSNKGICLLELAKRLSIPKDNIIACGDERNDISMIEAASVGVAVANARDELKAIADYITILDNNNGVVAEAVDKFILN